MTDCAITVRDDEAAAVNAITIGVVGPIRAGEARGLRELLRRTIHAEPDEPCPVLRIDLSCCTAIDVDGILALDAAQDAAQSRGGKLWLVEAPPLIADQLRRLNFEHLFVETGASGGT